MTTFLSGDPTMYKAYNEGKDLYAMIAMSAFDNKYEDNLEFWPEGTELEIDGQKVIAGKKTHLNKAGKERRSVGKVLNLAATYGMSGSTAGARLGKSREEGQKLLDNFFSGFSSVKLAIDNSKAFLKQYGYVEDFVGRRRRLSDINLNPYEAQYKVQPEDKTNFNPFLACTDRKTANDPVDLWNQILAGYVILSNVWHLAKDATCEIKNEIPNTTFEKYKRIAGNPKYYLEQLADPAKKPSMWNRKNRDKILEDMQALKLVLTDRVYHNTVLPLRAELEELINNYKVKYGTNVPVLVPEEPVILMAWTGRIAQAARQCFNARIQGSAASLTKMAMVDIFNDPILKECGAYLIITVHDEVLVECPEVYADIVERRLPELMIAAAKKVGDDVPQSCDPYNVTRWYADTAAATVLDEFKKAEKSGLSRDAAIQKVVSSHSEIPEAAIIKTLETGCDLDF